jgi:hypothetical protein
MFTIDVDSNAGESLEATNRIHCESCILAVGAPGILGLWAHHRNFDWQRFLREGRVVWSGNNNIYPEKRSMFAVIDFTQDRKAVMQITDPINWRKLWGATSDVGSQWGVINFARLVGPKARWQSFPADYTFVGLNGAPLGDYRAVGCDVTQLPIPPPITLEPFVYPQLPKPAKEAK